MKLSVVIPAYNEEQHIGRALTALVNQETKISFEVIVVDNGSTDQTMQVAQQFFAKLNLKIISESRRGRGAARAAGFSLAQGDIIYSTDADTQTPPNWLSAFIGAFEDTQVVAVSGTCAINDCSERTNKLFNWLQPQYMRAYRLFFRHYWLTGSNCAIRKSAYIKAKGFDPLIRDLEDIELGFRLTKHGRIAFMPTNVVITAGDRFQNGVWSGSWPYVRVFVQRFVLMRKSVSRDY